MNILDIKFCNDNTYLLKEISMTLEAAEECLKKYNYSLLYENYRSLKDENGAEKEQFPPINIAFYNYVFEHESIPCPEKMPEIYFELYKTRFEIKEECLIYNATRYNKNAVIARILRTYPSLVRDFDFYLRLKEMNVFDKVIYSCKDDIAGKDITIVHNNKSYVISLFVDTKRSWFYKVRKNLFRHKYDNNEIQVPLKLDTASKCGDFMVYNANDAEFVKNKIFA